MPDANESSECKCGGLARMADDPKDPVEFDSQLNEYHIPRKSNGGYSLVYFCPFCGGKAPKSKRSSLFQRLTGAERQRLSDLTKNLRTVQDVIAAFGEPDAKGQFGITVTTPETQATPETTQNFPVMTYTKLSGIADVHVTMYPTDRVGIAFQPKPMLAKQTHEFHLAPGPKPESPPQIDTRKRYDVYSFEPGREIVLYRNARFKGSGSLLPAPAGHIHYPDFVELEQANGQSIFVTRSSIFRFCEPGTEVVAEVVRPNKPDPR